jgi:hypothetical protein
MNKTVLFVAALCAISFGMKTKTDTLWASGVGGKYPVIRNDSLHGVLKGDDDGVFRKCTSTVMVDRDSVYASALRVTRDIWLNNGQSIRWGNWGALTGRVNPDTGFSLQRGTDTFMVLSYAQADFPISDVNISLGYHYTINGVMLSYSDVGAAPALSLTTGYIPKAASATTLGNSPIYTDGTNIGVGTALIILLPLLF